MLYKHITLTLAFAQGIYLSLFHDIYDVAYGGGSQNKGNPFHEIW